MDTKQLRMKSPDELKRLTLELRAELRDMRFKVATRQLSKVRELRKVRQQLARIATLLHQPSSSSP